MTGPVLEARGIAKIYDGATIIQDISLHLEQGELVCVLGVSGAGKTTLFHVLSGLTAPEQGNVYLGGEEITGRPGRVSYMLQKDLLLPHKRIVDNVALPLILRGEKKASAREKASALFGQFGLEGTQMMYPAQLSGGMRQRIVIAIALSENPDILICDEPTTALDVTIQAQILELINKVKRERKLSVIFITHDLGVVANMADRIAVMYAGKIVEIGTAEDIFYDPRHPYTWALLSSMPDLDTKEKLEAIPGTPPNMIYPPKGDAFAERNKYAMQIDFEQQPPMFKITDTHYAATWLLHPNAPKIEPPKSVTDRIARMKARVKKVGVAQSVQSENLEEPTEERRAEHLEQESAEDTRTMSETVFGGHETPGGQAMTEGEADAEVRAVSEQALKVG